MHKKSVFGFTLIEILIAMVIIASLVGGVLGSMTYVDKIARDAGLRMIVVNHGKEVLERLKNYVTADYASLPASLKTGENVPALAAGTHDCASNPAVCYIPAELVKYNGSVSYDVADRDLDAISNNGNEYKEVSVKIGWDKPGAN